MAQFYGEIRGKAARKATREGTVKSGIEAHIRGWDVGVQVECFVNEFGSDVCQVYRTGGSHSPSKQKLIASVAGPIQPKKK